LPNICGNVNTSGDPAFVIWKCPFGHVFDADVGACRLLALNFSCFDFLVKAIIEITNAEIEIQKIIDNKIILIL